MAVKTEFSFSSVGLDEDTVGSIRTNPSLIKFMYDQPFMESPEALRALVELNYNIYKHLPREDQKRFEIAKVVAQHVNNHRLKLSDIPEDTERYGEIVEMIIQRKPETLRDIDKTFNQGGRTYNDLVFMALINSSDPVYLIVQDNIIAEDHPDLLSICMAVVERTKSSYILNVMETYDDLSPENVETIKVIVTEGLASDDKDGVVAGILRSHCVFEHEEIHQHALTIDPEIDERRLFTDINSYNFDIEKATEHCLAYVKKHGVMPDFSKAKAIVDDWGLNIVGTMIAEVDFSEPGHSPLVDGLMKHAATLSDEDAHRLLESVARVGLAQKDWGDGYYSIEPNDSESNHREYDNPMGIKVCEDALIAATVPLYADKMMAHLAELKAKLLAQPKPNV